MQAHLSPWALGSKQSVHNCISKSQVLHLLFSHGMQSGILESKKYPGSHIGPKHTPEVSHIAHPVLQYIIHPVADPEQVAHSVLSQAILYFIK